MQGYKGALYENLAADFFNKMGRKLYYFHKNSGLEIDFVIRYQGKATLVEVKATNGYAKSLKTILAQPERSHATQGYQAGRYPAEPQWTGAESAFLHGIFADRGVIGLPLERQILSAVSGWVCFLSLLSTFLLSVAASIVAYYLCKWLDEKHQRQSA